MDTQGNLGVIRPVDHLCIVREFRRYLQDVRVKREADVASDHYLRVTRLKLKLKKS
ncbi:hypothetical protein DPMN_006596 [Dreissena polymorpha]|uniref:Uncharacterized protein n=1 Tax=Dreissena polymorpha TaxID=45954 RepID=A0A9D4MRR1_DREPO|nr:hypothetical protein DPMN_006596 [Dreissena polymorpha]